MFIRFVVGADDEHHRVLDGIFTESGELLDEHRLEPYEELWLDEIYSWFDTFLPCPPFVTKPLPRCSVAWFKAGSTSFITRMWDIVAIIEGHGLPVRLLRSSNPGKIVYEDDHQVVVTEWRTL